MRRIFHVRFGDIERHQPLIRMAQGPRALSEESVVRTLETNASQIVGTLPYMSPEQLSDTGASRPNRRGNDCSS